MKAYDRIRIVSLIGHLGRGGTERQLYLLLTHLDHSRFASDVLVFNRSNYAVYDDDLRRAGIGIHVVPDACRSIPKRMKFVFGKLRAIRPHIVHSWTAHDNPYSGIVGRLARVPVRWGSFRNAPAYAGFSNLPAQNKLLALRSVSRLVVNARKTLNQLHAEHGISSRRMLYLPNCVPRNPRPSELPDLAEFGIDAYQPVIGFVGNLRQVKNPQLFVGAMARVIEKHPHVRALMVGQSIAGEPDMPAQLAKMIEDRGLQSRVLLAGFRADVQALMHRFTVLAITSKSEGTPNVLLEAMSAGCPTVATSVGGIPEIIEDGVNGLLIETGDDEGLAQAVDRLLQDGSYACRLGSAGLQSAIKRFDCKLVARRLADSYIGALENQD